MKLTRTHDHKYELRFDYDPRKVKLARVLGGRFSKKDGDAKWVISSPEMVELLQSCNEHAKENRVPLDKYLVEHVKDIIDESQEARECAEMDFPVPAGRRLMRHQNSGVKWMVLNKSVLQADPMGAGKTIMCAVAANKVECKRVLIVCPASVKVNWRREWKSWNLIAKSGEQTVAVASGSFWPNTDVVVVNFDILHRFRTKYKREEGKIVRDVDKNPVVDVMGQIDAVDWDMIIVDECHMIKGRAARRTRALIGHWSWGKLIQTMIEGKRKIAMSGTPIPNRPEEIWPTAFWLWPETFPNFHLFGMRYCGAKRGKWGWSYKGSSNEKELNARLRLMGMMSRPKSITHEEVPEKSRKIIEFPIKGMAKLVEDEKSAYYEHEKDLGEIRAKAEAAQVFNDEGGFRDAMRELNERVELGVGKLTKARLDIARAKVEHVKEYIEGELESGREKIVVFCWHREIASALYKHFRKQAVMIDGGVPAEQRQRNIDKFQSDPECKIFVGTIASCGAGITLTAANLMLFVELHWVPGDIAQAEDRCHRKGQKRNLEVRYLVVEGSIDSVMSERIIDKLEVIEACTGPIQQALSNIPVSAVEDEDLPVASTPYNELEDMASRLRVTKVYTVRDRLLQVARGRCKKPHQIDQIVAGRLSNKKDWTLIQQALAELLVKRYYTEDYQERMF